MSGTLGGVVASVGTKRIFVVEKSKTTSVTSGTTLASSAINITLGKVYIAILAWDPSGASVPTVTVADTRNTYTSMGALFTAPATTTAGGGVITQAFIMTPVVAGTLTVTATFSAAIANKTMTIIELFNATSTQRNTLTTSRGTTSAPNYASPSGNIGDLILTTVAQETNIANQPTSGATSTTGGTWSTISNNFTTGGNAAANIGISYQYKVLTATGTQTNTWTISSTNNWGSQSFVIQAA